jgi:hypothetical protein
MSLFAIKINLFTFSLSESPRFFSNVFLAFCTGLGGFFSEEEEHRILKAARRKNIILIYLNILALYTF